MPSTHEDSLSRCAVDVIAAPSSNRSPVCASPPHFLPSCGDTHHCPSSLSLPTTSPSSPSRMWRCPSPSRLSHPSLPSSSSSSSSLLSFLCLFFISCVILSSAPSTVLVLAAECEVSPTAWVLLRFNLRTGGDSALSSSSNIQIEVDNTTVSRLQAVTTKLAVVSIIGPYRTGKSTLLNRLLPPNIPPSVFSVGHTVQPHTEEVSVYVIPPCALQGITLPPDTSLVFVDTPGLFAPNRVPLFDSQLLAVLNLISSVVVYNNVGVIKRVEVEQVHTTERSASPTTQSRLC